MTLWPDKGKTSFEIIDFVGATSHFADHGFDGYPTRIITTDADEELEDDDSTEDESDSESSDSGHVHEPEPSFHPVNPPPGPAEPSPSSADPGRESTRSGKFVVDSGDFYVVAEAVQVPDTSTGELVLTEYGEYVAGQIKRLATSPADLAECWTRQPTHEQVLDSLSAAEITTGELIPADAGDVDRLDMLVQWAWNYPTRTRAERAGRAREAHQMELEARSMTARTVLTALLDRYAEYGIDEVTSPEVLALPPICDLGSPREIDHALGDAGGLRSVIDLLQDWIYPDKSVA